MFYDIRWIVTCASGYSAIIIINTNFHELIKNFRDAVETPWKGNQLIAQGNALGCGKGVNSPWKGKRMVFW